MISNDSDQVLNNVIPAKAGFQEQCHSRDSGNPEALDARFRAEGSDTRVLKKIKADFREIKNGVPGRRFVDHYESSRRKDGARGGGWKTPAYVGAGLVLLICGLLASLPPGIPGFILWIPGLALIASRFRRLAILLDRLEAWARQAWRRLRPRHS